ncbi:MAG: GntR family transcriptional regulator [Planctomycetota bacterium]|nr:GntR family transcriptional regulator [Planctomycetota bacterium]
MALKVPRAPLHRRIADRMRDEFLRGFQPGAKLPSQNELAGRLGVSVLTVREALSALAEEGLIQRRQGSGTYLADLAPGRDVGVLIELDIAHPRTSFFFLRVVQQTRLALRRRGYRARLYAGHLPPDAPWSGRIGCEEFWEDLERKRLRGVAAVGLNADGPWWTRFQGYGIPAVGGGLGFARRVRLEDGRMIQMGVDYLVSQGRRRIACMSWGRPAPFVEALKAHGLAARPEWIRCDLHPASAGAGWEELRELWAGAGEKPDGLVIGDDMLFLDARSALLELRLAVPAELTIVTHANRGATYPASFPVAKLEVDPDAYAQALGDLLADAVERRPRTPEELVVPVRLVADDATDTLKPRTPVEAAAARLAPRSAGHA